MDGSRKLPLEQSTKYRGQSTVKDDFSTLSLQKIQNLMLANDIKYSVQRS